MAPRFSRRLVGAVAFVTSVAVGAATIASPFVWIREAEAAAPGTAGAVEIEILALSSNDAVEEAAALTDAFKHAMMQGEGVSEPANGKAHALEAITLTVGCDDPMTDAACAKKIAVEIKQDRFIFGTVKKAGTKLTATLVYYDNGTLKTVPKTYDTGPFAKDGTSPELGRIALDALYALVGGPPKGKVAVTVTGPAQHASGDVFEAGEKVGRVDDGQGTLDLPSGSHTIELRIEGYGPTTATVQVTPTGTTVTLAPIELSSHKPLDWQLYGGIGAIAVGAVFVGVGVATSLSIKSDQNDSTFTQYRERFPSSVGDTCAQAKAGNEGRKPPGGADLAPQVASLCDSVSKKETLQWVWYGLGAAFIGGGVVLIVTDKSGDGAANGAPKAAKAPDLTVRVQPTFGPNAGALSIVGAF